MDFNKTEKIVGYVRWVCLNTPFSDSDKPTIQSAHAHNVVEVWDDLYFMLVKACERQKISAGSTVSLHFVCCLCWLNQVFLGTNILMKVLVGRIPIHSGAWLGLWLRCAFL